MTGCRNVSLRDGAPATARLSPETPLARATIKQGEHDLEYHTPVTPGHSRLTRLSHTGAQDQNYGFVIPEVCLSPPSFIA